MENGFCRIGRTVPSFRHPGKDLMLKISILGLGVRGANAYGQYIHDERHDCKIVAICDADKEKAEYFSKVFEVDPSNVFCDAEVFFEQKRSDVLIIATPDNTHLRFARWALELGYHLFLETPVSDDPSALKELSHLASETGKVVMLANVLRYSAAINKIKELIDEGKIGQLVSVDYTENVGFWHMAHSYVRGNWRRVKDSTPMILTKCCHDFDILLYMIGARCKTVSSIGSLAHFKKENAPKGAGERCVACKCEEDCPYSAKKIYIDLWKGDYARLTGTAWPMNALVEEKFISEETLTAAIENGPYGKCVYACDNDVVDNQTVIMSFENRVNATMKMEAFVKHGGRTIRVFGSKGELVYDAASHSIVLKRFFGRDEEWDCREMEDVRNPLVKKPDQKMLDDFFDCISSAGDKHVNHDFMESHFIALAAEESRLGGGQAIDIFKFRNSDGIIKQILEWIDGNYTDDSITMKTVAKRIGYSVGYCSQIFRMATNMDFRDYINLKRLKRVKELLSDKTLNLTTFDILYQCGFKCPSTFYRVKKRLEDKMN